MKSTKSQRGPRTSRTDDIVHSLSQAITAQAIRPGTKLPEGTIGQHFGVSRTIVRTAITRLHAQGLVDVHRNRGAVVASPTLEEARQVFDTRRCLEREIMTLLSGRVASSEMSRLESHISLQDKAQLKSTEPQQSIRLAGEFHVLLAELTGNKVLRGFVAELVGRSSLILAVHGHKHSAECAVAEHREIVSELRAGDVTRTVQCMERHLRAVESRAFNATVAPSNDISEVLKRYA